MAGDGELCRPGSRHTGGQLTSIACLPAKLPSDRLVLCAPAPSSTWEIPHAGSPSERGRAESGGVVACSFLHVNSRCAYPLSQGSGEETEDEVGIE